MRLIVFMGLMGVVACHQAMTGPCTPPVGPCHLELPLYDKSGGVIGVLKIGPYPVCPDSAQLVGSHPGWRLVRD